MDKPKSPCKKDCDFRSANCHNESCPYGWVEYERQKKEYDISKQKVEATFPVTQKKREVRIKYARKSRKKFEKIYGIY